MEQAIPNTVFEAGREIREMAAAEQQREDGHMAQFQDGHHTNSKCNQREGDL
jgi:hypothetical protein